MNRVFLFSICAFLTIAAVSDAKAAGVQLSYSDIRADEQLIFFRTSGWLDEANDEWHLPIHGWIYEAEDSLLRKALLGTVLEEKYELIIDPDAEENFSARLDLMIADSERGKYIVVTLAGREFALPPSTANGHIETTLVVPAAELEGHIDGREVTYSVVTKPSDGREFGGEVLLVDPVGLSIISDIDDTVKISEVTDHRKLLEHSFLLDFEAVPGMAKFYDEISEPGSSVHFVSSSPWQLFSPLNEFLQREDFSNFVINLKPVRFRDETLFDLFKKGTQTKPKVIENILHSYPQRRFVLVGDSGEHDPEVYAAIAQEYPDQILQIFIRNVTGETSDNERFSGVFADLSDELWHLVDDTTAFCGLRKCL